MDIQIQEILKWLSGVMVGLVPAIVAILKINSDINKQNAEANKANSDATNNSKTVEADVLEKIIKAAGDLIESYKDANSSLSVRMSELEIKVNTTQSLLEKEIKKRERLERNTKEFIIGIKKLLNQLRELNQVPVWEPKIDIDIVDTKEMS